MKTEISELLKYRRSIRDKYNWPPNSKMGTMVSFIWLWHNYPLELRKYARRHNKNWGNGLCPVCSCDLKVWKEMFGEEHKCKEK